jgi:hypothetical protein
MRKLFLIAAVAFATATPCYANLSLASVETSPAATEQPKASGTNARTVRGERSVRFSRHRQHRWTVMPFSRYFGYGFHDFRGGC